MTVSFQALLFLNCVIIVLHSTIGHDENSTFAESSSTVPAECKDTPDGFVIDQHHYSCDDLIKKKHLQIYSRRQNICLRSKKNCCGTCLLIAEGLTSKPLHRSHRTRRYARGRFSGYKQRMQQQQVQQQQMQQQQPQNRSEGNQNHGSHQQQQQEQRQQQHQQLQQQQSHMQRTSHRGHNSISDPDRLFAENPSAVSRYRASQIAAEISRHQPPPQVVHNHNAVNHHTAQETNIQKVRFVEDTDAINRNKANIDSVRETDPCAGTRCFNGGMCKPDVTGPNKGGFECICRMNFRGKYCEKSMEECHKLNCKKIRDCGSSPSGSTCICTGDGGDTQMCIMDKKTESEWKKIQEVLSENTVRTGEIILAVSGSIILLVTLCLCVHCGRARSRKNKLLVQYREAVESGFQPSESPPTLTAVSNDLFKTTFCGAKSRFPESYMSELPARTVSVHEPELEIVEFPVATRSSTRSLMNQAKGMSNVRLSARAFPGSHSNLMNKPKGMSNVRNVRLSAHAFPSRHSNMALRRSTSILRKPSMTYSQRKVSPDAIEHVIKKQRSSRSIGSFSHIPASGDIHDEPFRSRHSRVHIENMEPGQEASCTSLPPPPDDDDNEPLEDEDVSESEESESEPEPEPEPKPEQPVFDSGSRRGSLLHAPRSSHGRLIGDARPSSMSYPPPVSYGRLSNEILYNISRNARRSLRNQQLSRSARTQKDLWDIQAKLNYLRLKYRKDKHQQIKQDGQNTRFLFQ